MVEGREVLMCAFRRVMLELCGVGDAVWRRVVVKVSMKGRWIIWEEDVSWIWFN